MEYSDPCQWCGDRIIVWPKSSREGVRRWHEDRCDLSVDCGYCQANVGQRCTTRGGKPSPTHQGRRYGGAW